MRTSTAIFVNDGDGDDDKNGLSILVLIFVMDGDGDQNVIQHQDTQERMWIRCRSISAAIQTGLSDGASLHPSLFLLLDAGVRWRWISYLLTLGRYEYLGE